MVNGGDARLEIEGSALPVRFEAVPAALRIASARVGP
jgi:hypothetical protein